MWVFMDQPRRCCYLSLWSHCIMRPADQEGTATEKTVCYSSHEEAGSPHPARPRGAAAGQSGGGRIVGGAAE